MKVHHGMTWRALLNTSLAEYKQTHPDTTLTDWEILESLMEHLAESGLVRKNADGKYIVGPIIGRLQ